MEPGERKWVLEQLTTSEGRLLGLVEGLTAAQWEFRETEGRWSIADNVEHCVLLEEFILGMIERALAGEAQPEKRANAMGKDAQVRALGSASARATKLSAREVVRPVGTWTDRAEMLAMLRRARARTMAFASETNADLRSYFFPHIAFGDLDCYQWLVVLARHAERHAMQIEEIMVHPGYPAG